MAGVRVGVNDGNTMLLLSLSGEVVGDIAGPEVFVVSDLPIKTPIARTMINKAATTTMFNIIVLFLGRLRMCLLRSGGMVSPRVCRSVRH